MPTSAALIDHLASNVTFIIPLWKITASDTSVAAYCAHTRDLTFNSVLYKAAPVEPTSFTETLGVRSANNVELFGVFDDVITEPDVQGGRWRNAAIYYEMVNYMDLTMGSVKKIKGQVGKFDIQNGTYRVEMRSLSDRLQQDIGQMTSPLDRRRRLEDLGISTGPFIFARTVTAFADRRNFTVGGTAQVNDYFAYGRAVWTSGANNGLQMEIKASVGNVIELQLPMRSNIAVSDTVSLYAGYNGTRDQCRTKFAAVEGFDGEPDLPSLRAIIKYPE